MKPDIMKVITLKFILAFLITFIFYGSSVAQQRPEPIKFDDYTETTIENLKLLDKKTKAFAKRMRKEPVTTRAFIIYYVNLPKNCRDKSKTKPEKRVEYVRDRLLNKYRFPPDQIVVASADHLRVDTKIEFWIVPKDAYEPRGRDGIFLDGGCSCPKIWIEPPMQISDLGKPLIFTGNISGGTGGGSTYKWTLSAGKIISGQGSPVAEVDLSGTNEKEIKISLEIETEDCCMDYCSQAEPFIVKVSPK